MRCVIITRKHILILEDDPVLSSTLEAVLGVFNTVVTAGSLSAAREQLLQATSFEVVLLDRQLPDGEGTDLIPEVRGRHGEAAIIVMTGDADYYAAGECLSQGADDYLVKSSRFLQDLQRDSVA